MYTRKTICYPFVNVKSEHFHAANFIHWRLILEKIYDVNSEMAILAIEFYDAIYGRYQTQPRYFTV